MITKHSPLIQENAPLAPLTTLKIGGPARYFVKAETERDVVEALRFADEIGTDLFVMGGGSNILISDSGFDGVVVQIAIKGIKFELGRSAFVTAQAGEDWDPFVMSCVERRLAGVECLSGIPGFVGGTPVQNVGAYGQEVSETIVNVRCFDRSAKTFVELGKADCRFEYRKSIFNSSERDRYIVLAVTFSLDPGGEPKIVYKDLRNHFGDRSPSLSEARDAVLAIRRAKSMVIDEADANSRSAGSFFKNPLIRKERFDELAKRTGIGIIPHFDAGEGLLKIPAAWLIERAGFQKGYRRGKAGISTNHSLALVNLGGASATDIIELKEEIQGGVQNTFGITLQPEPVFVGFKD